MGGLRRLGYDALRKHIGEKLKKTAETLKELKYASSPISPKEFYDYMTGETSTGDTITIADVLDNTFLLVHEVVEISELKRMGLPTGSDTAVKFRTEVYGAHYAATEIELQYAASKRNLEWLRKRAYHAKSWLEDDAMPAHLVPRCKAILKQLAELVPEP